MPNQYLTLSPPSPLPATQAVPMQADAPSQLEHVKVAMMEYMAQVKETAQRSIDLLDDTEYKEYK